MQKHKKEYAVKRLKFYQSELESTNDKLFCSFINYKVLSKNRKNNSFIKNNLINFYNGLKNKNKLKFNNKFNKKIIKYPNDFFIKNKEQKKLNFSYILLVNAQRKNTFINFLDSSGKVIYTFSIGNKGIKKSERKKAFYLREISSYLIECIQKVFINEKWIFVIKGPGPGRRLLTNIYYRFLQYNNKFMPISIIDYTKEPFTNIKFQKYPRR